MKHGIYIATKDRESDVIRLLASIEENEATYEILVIDSTEPQKRFNEFNHLMSATFPKMKINHIYHKGRLPSARNAGIDFGMESHLIHFFDDDATIPKDYFKKIEEFLDSHPDADGGGPRILGSYLPRKNIEASFLKKILSRTYDLRFSIKKYGKVSKSCKNTWVQDLPGTEQMVDWIPGCAMFFKPEIFQFFRFNAKMENGLKGYAFGEDMEFTYRVSRKFKLYAVDTCSIVHHLTPSPRTDLPFIASCLGNLTAHMHLMYPKKFPVWRIYFAKCWELFIAAKTRGLKFRIIYGNFHRSFCDQMKNKTWSV